MTKSIKRLLFTVVLTILTFPLWKWLATLLVQPKDYVPAGEKGTEMVTGLGSIFVLTILMAVSLLFFYYLSGQIFKKN